MVNEGQGPRATTAERLERAPRVLAVYIRDIELHSRPLDSGLPGVLRFIAHQLPALIAAEKRVAELEGERDALIHDNGNLLASLSGECGARVSAEGERDTATRALEAIGSLTVMSEGNVAGGVISSREVDAIINAALSKTEGRDLHEAEEEGDYGHDPEKLRKLLRERDAFIVKTEMWGTFLTWLARLDDKRRD